MRWSILEDKTRHVRADTDMSTARQNKIPSKFPQACQQALADWLSFQKLTQTYTLIPHLLHTHQVCVVLIVL